MIDQDKEKLKRIKLLKLVPYIIAVSTYVDKYQENVIDGHKAGFWMIRRHIQDISVKVIIRQLGNGRKHFFSVIEENKKLPAKEVF